MIQHGNMMQLLLWHALSTLKDSLKEKAGRFPFPACCWAWIRKTVTGKHTWLLMTVASAKRTQTWQSIAQYDQYVLLTSIDSIRAVQWSWIFGSQIFWAFREMRDTKVPSHSNSRLSHFHHSLPGRAKISDTMWHPHTQRSQRQKKRNSSGPSAGPWDLVACPDIVAARASPDTEQKDIGTSCYILNILKHPEMLQRTCIVCITEYHWISGCCRPMLPSHCALLAFHTSRTKAFRRMVATL